MYSTLMCLLANTFLSVVRIRHSDVKYAVGGIHFLCTSLGLFGLALGLLAFAKKVPLFTDVPLPPSEHFS